MIYKDIRIFFFSFFFLRKHIKISLLFFSPNQKSWQELELKDKVVSADVSLSYLSMNTSLLIRYKMYVSKSIFNIQNRILVTKNKLITNVSVYSSPLIFFFFDGFIHFSSRNVNSIKMEPNDKFRVFNFDVLILLH